MAATTKITFFYDFISPYSFLAFRQMKELRAKYKGRVNVSYKPVVFGALLSHWGSKGPAEVPPKREWVFRDVFRQAKLRNISFSVPRAHPFLPLFPLRLTLKSTCNDDLELQEHLIDAIYTSLWADKSGLGIYPSEAEFKRVAEESLPSGYSIDTLFTRAKSENAKQELKAFGDEAISARVFGVPTLLVYLPGEEKPEFFWGSDQMSLVEMCIQGKGHLFKADPAYESAVKNIPAAAVRPQSKM